MKPLHYAALADPDYAPRLAQQVHESLRPFVSYLNSAKQAAKEREARSWMKWELVPSERQIRLEPLDSLLEIASEGFTYALLGWAGDAPDMPLFVGSTFRPVKPARVSAGPNGPELLLAEELDPTDAVFWAGQKCELRLVPSKLPDQLFGIDSQGARTAVRHKFQVRGQTRVVVEGTERVGLIGADGVPIPTLTLLPEDGSAKLATRRISMPWSGERSLTVSAPPDEDVLTADTGVRWQWSEAEGRGRRKRGVWVQLLQPMVVENDATTDPRAAYCEEGVRSVRTEKAGGPKNEYKVFGFRRDNYRLELDRLPPEGAEIFLPANLGSFNQQLNAVYRLKDAPLPHHRGILALCEAPELAKWPAPKQVRISDTDWFLLKDAKYDGTQEQREFVSKALGTEDFAFLEGPPGSGKTHAICELVLQLIAREKRVLLCSTTHVAVDNVLERLSTGDFPQVEAVRIGKADRIDSRVSAFQLDARIDRLFEAWHSHSEFAGLEEKQLEQMALGTILASTNLTCGTTTGILRHPYLARHEDGGVPGWAHFDVLIVDEASKSTLQEFLVPAQLARRWVIVGDVRQLPPFTESKDLEASIAEVSEDTQAGADGRLSDAYQRACLIHAELKKEEAGGRRSNPPHDPPVRWLIDEPMAVLDALVAEVTASAAMGRGGPSVVRISQTIACELDISVAQLLAGEAAALRLLAAHWVLVSPELISQVERFLPGDLLSLRGDLPLPGLEARHRHWVQERGRLHSPIRVRRGPPITNATELMSSVRTFLGEESWAKQIAWRLGRVHQLGRAKGKGDREARQQEIENLLPLAAEMEWVASAIDAIRDVGVRSVIEALRVPRTQHRVRRRSALTDAMPDATWGTRSKLLTRQHRMHPDISAFPRDEFYEQAALLDANTLLDRDTKIGWSFTSNPPQRRVWAHVLGEEYGGSNPREVEAMRRVLEHWRVWASGHPRNDGRPWEVACLSFYNKQEIAIRDMLRRLSSQGGGETRFALPNTQLACATVDRFQGREADLVLLSFRNTKRPGHADSPNRLNVAITRARFQLVIFGNRQYFERCPSDELSALAKSTPVATHFQGQEI